MLARHRAAVWVTCASLVLGSAPSLSVASPTGATDSVPAQLGSSAIEGGAALNEGVFVRSVLANNPTVESARQGWRAAIARVRQAGVLDDPMVDLGAAPLSVGVSGVPFGYSVGVSQKLPWFGKRASDSAVASAEASAARSDFEATRRDLALTAALLYDQYFLSVRSLEINEAHVALMRQLRAAATAQFEAGRGSMQDPLQAEAELTHMEHEAIHFASERDIIVAQMNELLHRDADLPLPPPPRELFLPAGPGVDDPKRLELVAIESRPEIAAAHEHARAETARAERASREWYPDVTVSTSYNSMWSTPEHRWMVGLGFNLPIQGGRRNGAADEANASRARFESEVARLADKARVEVVVAQKQLIEAHHIVVLYEDRLLPVARAQVDAARSGFIASQNPFMAVIDAERNLRTVDLGYQEARADCDRRHAELDRALGRIPGIGDQGGAR